MRIETIKVQNFKSLQNIQVKNIPALTNNIGANGSGKSTIFDVFGFLKDCLTFNVTRAMQSRGGYLELVSRGQTGKDIIIDLQYRMMLTGKERLVTYHLNWDWKKVTRENLA